MVIFLAAIPPTPLPPPPTLEVSPTNLSADDPNCSGGKSAPRCTVEIRETATSEGNVQWQATSDMGKGIVFSPAQGTLSPGQSIKVEISDFPCQNGSFTFSGSRHAAPVSVLWQCTPPLERLERSSATFKLNVSDVPGLLNNSPAVIADLKQQIKGQSVLNNRSVGLAIAYGGAPDVASTKQAQDVAGKIYEILLQLGTEGFVFQRASYYTNLFILNKPLNEVSVDVYLFCTNMEGNQCNR
jgi:hypothetical protein